MHISKPVLRLVAFFVVIVGAMLAFNSLPPAGDHGAQALGNLTGTSCADIYLDLPPAQVNKGDPPGPEDLLVGKSLTRTEARSAIAAVMQIAMRTQTLPPW